jgi:hypothetical protein
LGGANPPTQTQDQKFFIIITSPLLNIIRDAFAHDKSLAPWLLFQPKSHAAHPWNRFVLNTIPYGKAYQMHRRVLAMHDIDHWSLALLTIARSTPS